MKLRLAVTTGLLAATAAATFAGESGKQIIEPPLADSWKLDLSIPGWFPGIEGDTGINGSNAHVNIDAADVFRHYDMAAIMRAEVSKGRFGIGGDFLYTSLSDGVGTKTVVKKVSLQVDQSISELTLRWRLIDHPRGTLDVVGGARYIYLNQDVQLQSNEQRIDEVAQRIAMASTAARSVIARRELVALAGRNPTVPIAPLSGDQQEAFLRYVSRLRGTVAERTEAIQKRLRKITSTHASRTDDWWDPIVGVRARYNFNDRFYASVRGDIGGFGVGSELTWQAEASLGCKVTPRIYAELGYRALSIDYDSNGLLYDLVMHGVQFTTGIEF